MTNLEEKIPALSMWKIFYDTIELLQLECSESNIKHLANIVNSQKLTSILVYNHDPTLTFEQYEDISNKYKAFTVWLLGRFFYLSSCEKLSRIHKLVIDAQLRILHLISITQPHIYHDLTDEYTNILKELNKYEPNETKHLTVFKPAQFDDLRKILDLSSVIIDINSVEVCSKLKLKILKFVGHILVENLCFYNLDVQADDNLDDLNHILREDNLELKLAVFEIYKIILEKPIIAIDEFPFRLKEKFCYISGSLEQLTYDLFNEKSNLDGIIATLVDILIVFVKNESNFNHNSQMRVSQFIVNSKCNFENLKFECGKLLIKFSSNSNLFQNLSINKYELKYLRKSLTDKIKQFISENSFEEREFNSYLKVVFNDLVVILKQKLNEYDCTVGCVLKENLEYISEIINTFIKVKLSIVNIDLNVNDHNYVNESEFLLLLISFVNKHVQNCKVKYCHETFVKICSSIPIFSTTENVEILFHIVAYQFMPLFYKSNNELPVKLYGCYDRQEVKINLKILYDNLALKEESKDAALKNVLAFMSLLSSNLVNMVSNDKMQNLQDMYMKIILSIAVKGALNNQLILANNIQHIVSFLKNKSIILKVLQNLTNQQNSVYATLIKMIPQVICMLYSNYVKIVTWNDFFNFTIRYICISCNFSNTDKKHVVDVLRQYQTDDNFMIGLYENNFNELSSDITFAFLWKLCNSEKEIADVMKILPRLSNHFLEFHSPENAKQWIKFAGNNDKVTRKSFSEIILSILQFMQQNTSLSSARKEEILDVCLDELFILSKESLQFSNYDLQDTLLDTFERLTYLKMKAMILKTMKILLYFIMVPTSKYSAISVNIFLELANRCNTKTTVLYRRYRRELCQYIVELCAINQALINYDLNTSLEKVSLVLGFYGAKDFVNKENYYLLQFFVGLIVTMPKVLKLIEEIGVLTEMELGDLLATNYGNIFLHIFLNESDTVLQKCMIYLEETTGLSAPVLRKRNFKTILNELLLNFHEKRDRVVSALNLLAREDTDAQSIGVRSIPDYLQPRFLGVLQYFDTKLLAKKQVLLSLEQIFKFMGPKRIAPFRFKITAMLRTALTLNHGTYPELNCNVWDAFIRSCDIETLGPQLATIFVSILPLCQHNESKINNIFRYLVIENENLLRDYIPELFFAVDFDIGNDIQFAIRKHMKKYEQLEFKKQLKLYLKYLTQDTNDIRIYGLKVLKKLIERNREELDQMVLGYNGIDSIVVELLEVLTQGCRQQDHALRMASGECIGELGAIEPSHLPRKYTQAQTFTFFINEDQFILNSLSELIRALQAEKNTKIMDKFALAIQGTLKTYGISPETNSPKHNLWKSFSQPHQELMLPLLSSRYTCQPLTPTNISPIYGSAIGTNFQTWVYNWTCSLILTMKSDKRPFLEMCVPSLKQDHRTLMHFLPHILLHSLLEGTQRDLKRTETEFMAIFSSFRGKKAVDDDVFDTRPLRTSHHDAKPSTVSFEDVKRNQCTKVIFILLDFLDRWVREWEWQRGATGMEDVNYKTIQNFLSRFCKLQLAQCSFHCQEYPRTLMYLEEYIAKNTDQLYNHLSFLAEVYAQLDEPDTIAGVTALQNTEPTLDQRILALEVAGKLSDASACYERIAPPLKLRHLQGLIQCYLDLDNVNTALNLAEGALENQPEYGEVLLQMQAEPLWRLGKYDKLDNLLKKRDLEGNQGWSLQIGQALLHLQNGKRDDFQEVLKNLRLQQINALSSTSLEEGVYQHGYNFIAKLHILTELEQVERVIYDLLLKHNDHNACESFMRQIASEWGLRFKVVQESIKIVEPILCLRRVALEQAKRIVQDKVPNSVSLIDSLLGECWLLSSKIARHSGVHQQAYTYTLKAEEYAPPRLFLEKAKLHWMREEHEQALIILKRGLEKILPENYSSSNNSSTSFLNPKQKELCAEAKLLIATYNDNISNVDNDVNILHYKEAIDMNKEWEKSFIAMAQYLDRVFQTYSDEDRDAIGSEMQIRMINYFGKSLQYGTTYVYQSMPRMLSIWFDYGTRLLNVVSLTVKEERKNNLLKMTKLIDSFLERLPSYIFLTAFSQIISRICHPQKEVYIELKSIVTKLILQYPQQTMWMMISVIKSSYTVRSKRCAEIFFSLKNPTITKLVGDFTKLAEKLIELCNKEINENVTMSSVNTLLRSLPRLLAREDFSEIMIPTQKFRKLVLPNPDFKSSQHNPFPNHYVHIVSIEDEVTVLTSLQRPRKITFKGSDGRKYIQMLKPKDDLRKDFRLMEFNDIVNQLLARDADSRQRRLNIRLYSVVPLNEECGLIEWVPNLLGLRPILMNLYKQRGQGMKARELRDGCPNNKDPLAKKRDIFERKLLPRHPPVLGDWFRKTFPDAQGWLTARTAYTRTTAVISMVGYILGLGDRHGENILLDSTCGDTVHVDFNCLFNKGESFEWPERVPFRLTHNMVSAMGPLGVEGVFRKSCACTLRVLRTHTNTLMSIVTPFVYDPLVSWPRNNTVTTAALNSERTNEQAVEHVRNIELRLKGMMRTKGRSISIPLSVEGQTNNVILEAMNVNNLCQMYVGWGAYL